jgi:hypothetical protein
MIASDGSLGAKEDRFYDRHFVATYNKNINSGLDELITTIPGHKQVEIHY